MSSRRGSSKNMKVSYSSSDEGDITLNSETISTDEESSYSLLQSRSVSVYSTSSEEEEGDYDSDETSESQEYKRSISKKKRSSSRDSHSHSKGTSLSAQRRYHEKQLKRLNNKIRASKPHIRTNNNIRKSSHSKPKKDSGRKESSRSSSKKEEKKSSKKSKSRSSKKEESSKKKKPTPPRKRSEKKAEVVIHETDPASVKLAKSIPDDLVAKLNLNNNKTTIFDITKRIYERDDTTLFAKLVVASNLIFKANFTVGLPSSNGFTYEEVYTCLMNEKKVIDLERCADATHPKAKFRRLPIAFANRTAMLQLFNDKAPKEKKDEILKPSCKEKVVTRMNWLLNNGDDLAELAVPAPNDPCSEICIVENDGDDETPLKMVCIWQAAIIRKYHLLCVKSKNDTTPSLPDIEAVVLARQSIVAMLNAFIDDEDGSTTKRKRDHTKEVVKPEKKTKLEPVLEDPVVETVAANTEAHSESSSSTSSSDEDSDESDEGPRSPVQSTQQQQMRPLFETFADKVAPTPNLLNLSEADLERKAKRVALLAQFHKG